MAVMTAMERQMAKAYHQAKLSQCYQYVTVGGVPQMTPHPQFMLSIPVHNDRI